MCKKDIDGYTPKSWSVRETKSNALEVVDRNGRPICELWRRGKPREEYAAAVLMASAPDILAERDRLWEVLYKIISATSILEYVQGVEEAETLIR